MVGIAPIEATARWPLARVGVLSFVLVGVVGSVADINHTYPSSGHVWHLWALGARTIHEGVACER